MPDGGFSKSEMHHVACGCTCCQCVVMSCFIKNFMVRVTIWRPGTCKSQYQGPYMMMQHWSVQARSHLEKRWKESNSLYEKISEFPRTTLRSAGWWNVPAIIRKMAYRRQWQNTETHQKHISTQSICGTETKKLPEPQGLPFKNGTSTAGQASEFEQNLSDQHGKTEVDLQSPISPLLALPAKKILCSVTNGRGVTVRGWSPLPSEPSLQRSKALCCHVLADNHNRVLKPLMKFRSLKWYCFAMNPYEKGFPFRDYESRGSAGGSSWKGEFSRD